MRRCKKSTVPLLLIIATTVLSSPINKYESVYAPAHEYKEQDYSFSYGVKDMHSGDVKTQWEKKEGDVITGRYSLVEADGSVRTVEYTADAIHGFNAVVKHDGIPEHPSTPQPLIRKEIHKEIQINHISPKIIKTDYKEFKNELGHSYEYKESSPGISMYTYESRKIPQQESNEISASTQYFNFKPVEQIATNAITPTPQSYFLKNAIPKLPVDITLFSGGEQIIPVDVSKINPIEINLNEATKFDPTNIKLPLHPSPSHELGIYFRDFTKDKFTKPQLEKGFKPIITTSTPASLGSSPLPKIPNTFKSGKKPVTTPGLRHYATKSKDRVKSLHKTHPNIHTGVMPLIFAKQIGDFNNRNILQKAEVIRLHPTSVKNGHVRYATHVRFVEDEK